MNAQLLENQFELNSKCQESALAVGAAEGASATPNGALNAQAKGLTTVPSVRRFGRSLLERGRTKYGPPKEQARIAG